MDKQKTYHHGDLKNLLISKVLEAVKKNNLENFSIREATRLLNVSAAAPYKHFSDKQSLIIAAILHCQNIFYTYLFHEVKSNTSIAQMQLINLGKNYLKYANKNRVLSAKGYSEGSGANCSMSGSAEMSTEASARQRPKVSDVIGSGHLFTRLRM